jgi:hypothetical protein
VKVASETNSSAASERAHTADYEQLFGVFLLPKKKDGTILESRWHPFQLGSVCLAMSEMDPVDAVSESAALAGPAAAAADATPDGAEATDQTVGPTATEATDQTATGHAVEATQAKAPPTLLRYI